MNTELPDILEIIGESPGPFDRLLGLRLVHADPALVKAVLPIRPDLLQAHGIVHGGVYCSAIEVTASVGAALRAGAEHRVVGISNRTQFLRACTSGTLQIEARLESDDAPRYLWDVTITDEKERKVAIGQVQLLRLG